MADPVIRLDKSKPSSECRGERAPDDPHYKVHFWQGFKVGKATVLLPFDSSGVLVADDGKTEPYQGLVEGKPVMHNPLYSAEMRALVDRIKARMIAGTAEEEDAEGQDEVVTDSDDAGDTVNLAAWLRGEIRYLVPELRAAAKQRLHHTYHKIYPDLVVDLVLDEKLVPENEVCAELAKHLPPKAA